MQPQSTIETERLFIRALTYPQLVQYINADPLLEQELRVAKSDRTVSPDLKEALEQTILPNVADPKRNYLYNTLWTLIAKAENRMVGDLCFVGEPNENGEVEIGYGMYEGAQKNGYMTEAVGAMLKWAKKNPAIKAVVAGTEKTNTASFGVLLRNNFIKSGETDTLFTWRYQF